MWSDEAAGVVLPEAPHLTISPPLPSSSPSSPSSPNQPDDHLFQDVPAVLSFVLEKTGALQVHWIGEPPRPDHMMS